MTRSKKASLKFASVLLFLSVMAVFMPSCAYKPIESTESEARIVGNVGEYEIRYENLRYITAANRTALENKYGDGIWDDAATAEKYRDELYRDIINGILRDCAVETLAKDVGYKKDDYDIKKNVDEFMKEFTAELGGMGKYRKYLKENRLSDSFLRYSVTTDYLENALLYAYINNGMISDDMAEILDSIIDDGIFVRTSNIYISAEGGDIRGYDEAKKLADSAYAELEAGADFFEVAKKYSDEKAEESDDGLYFTYGETDKDYEDAAMALDVGEYSRVTPYDGGFVIILRREISESYVMLNINSLKDRYQYSALGIAINTCREGLEFVPNEYFKTLDLTKID